MPLQCPYESAYKVIHPGFKTFTINRSKESLTSFLLTDLSQLTQTWNTTQSSTH